MPLIIISTISFDVKVATGINNYFFTKYTVIFYYFVKIPLYRHIGQVDKFFKAL